MSSTAKLPDEAAAAVFRAQLRAFLAARRTRSLLGAAVVCGAVTALVGSWEAAVPTAVEQGRAVIPLWRMMAMAVAVLPVLALDSRLSDLEVVATRRLRRLQRLHLAWMSAACLAVQAGLAALAVHPLLLIVIARSWLAWFGLALLAGALLGWRLAWTLPAAAAVILWYWGFAGDGRYQWWEFSARPHDDVPSLLLALVLCSAGLVAYSLTPWRRRAPRMRALRPGRGAEAPPGR
ncbi:hypothetical protein ACFQY4_22550 [Catellatospora bangladeshensis]|uniref:Uncharacterized protein n=1 Tax=Catellatospora bangladeshensis TaxID=310355 RepID=A0A8J3NII6_9ACTN|nr:hypothetical protein [Catellatospora bangladeshensis]GIF80411.1 hypothetical protein Cba03nite_17600 [Catellatospora bangladeshensis]